MKDPRFSTICEQVLERLYDFLNRRELAPSDIDEIRQHLKACPPCGGRYEFEERLLERLKDAHPCACPDRLRDRVKHLLEVGNP